MYRWSSTNLKIQSRTQRWRSGMPVRIPLDRYIDDNTTEHQQGGGFMAARSHMGTQNLHSWNAFDPKRHPRYPGRLCMKWFVVSQYHTMRLLHSSGAIWLIWSTMCGTHQTGIYGYIPNALLKFYWTHVICKEQIIPRLSQMNRGITSDWHQAWKRFYDHSQIKQPQRAICHVNSHVPTFTCNLYAALLRDGSRRHAFNWLGYQKYSTDLVLHENMFQLIIMLYVGD